MFPQLISSGSGALSTIKLETYLSFFFTVNRCDLSKQGNEFFILLRMVLQLQERKNSLCSMVSNVMKTNVFVSLSFSSNFSIILLTISWFFMLILILMSFSSFIRICLYSLVEEKSSSFVLSLIHSAISSFISVIYLWIYLSYSSLNYS
jgi:hypothetical protein